MRIIAAVAPRASRDVSEVSLLHRSLARGAHRVSVAGWFLLVLFAAPARAQSTVPPVLPESVAAELRAARVPLAAVAVTLVPLSGSGITMAINEHQSMNPASTMKLVTTLAGAGTARPAIRLADRGAGARRR